MRSLARLLPPVRRLIPNLGEVSHAERLRASLGALIGILMTGFVSRLAVGPSTDLPLLIAPMGASAVLLFAVPASPLAQPWSILGGNTIAALVGITCARIIADPMAAAAVACGCAIGGMLLLRCLHPPSGAVALTAVLGGPAIHAAGYGFALWPVGLNGLLLLGTALVFNNATGRPYPHLTPRPRATTPPDVSDRDIEAVLRRHRELLDIDRGDLFDLVHEVEDEARARHLPTLTCAQLMARGGGTVRPEMPIATALVRLAEEPRRSLMVTDAAGRLVGRVDQGSVIAHLRPLRNGRMASKLFERSLRLAVAPQTVADLMQAPAAAVAAGQPLEQAVALMVREGVTCVPVVDDTGVLLGLIDQGTLMTTMLRRHAPAQPRSAIQRL